MRPSNSLIYGIIVFCKLGSNGVLAHHMIDHYIALLYKRLIFLKLLGKFRLSGTLTHDMIVQVFEDHYIVLI